MDDNVRLMMDAADDVLDGIRKETQRLDIVMFALFEQAGEDTVDPEIPGMLTDAANHAKAATEGLSALRDYITDIAREIL